VKICKVAKLRLQKSTTCDDSSTQTTTTHTRGRFYVSQMSWDSGSS